MAVPDARRAGSVPKADHGKHASECLPIGTLAGVLAALAMGMAARSAAGLSVLQGWEDALELSRHRLVRELCSLALPAADYVVTGSGPLLAHGLRTVERDLDIVARGDAWKAALRLGEPAVPLSGYGCLVPLFGGDIEVFDRWLPGSPGPDAMIEAAEWVEGIPFTPLGDVLAWKERLGRPKDREDIRLIRRHLEMSEK